MAEVAVPSSAAGFTLIEVLVALVLFALISLAGLSLVEAMVGLERGSSHRLERLADVQRTLFLVGTDFGQLVDGPDRTAAGISFRRLASDGPHDILYRTDQAGLHRVVDGTDRLLLGGVGHVGWRFAKHGGWTSEPRSRSDAARPSVAELTFQLQRDAGQSPAGGAEGPVRKVIELPAEP
jgi:general secretion pathway protein J